MTSVESKSPVRYAVVGLGHIAQAAVLPAFAHATENSKLAALVSGDPEKRKKLGKKYRVPALAYEDYDGFLASGECDAVYIALPNNLHADYTIRAAEQGVHVLCEKPMAVTEEECERMIRACAEHDVRLMIAYRLHFESANLRAIEILQSGEIGEPKFFTSSFGFQVDDPNIRTERELGGGVLYDIGIYCLNAARYLFREEPTEVFAFSSPGSDPRFEEVAETWAVSMRFPRGCLAQFTTSFNCAGVSTYEVVGTRGVLRLNPAYDWTIGLKQELTIDGQKRRRSFPKRDQFAAELIRFSQAILEDRDAEPTGHEGLADVRIIQALIQSAKQNAPVKLRPTPITRRPTPDAELNQPPSPEPALVNVDDPKLD